MIAKFHLHVDAVRAPQAFLDQAETFGYTRCDFSGHAEGRPHYEPAVHLTRKFTDAREFRRAFLETRALASSTPEFDGYVEGEYIAADFELPELPYDPRAKLGFVAHPRPLPPGQFRQSEVHITMSRTSRPELVDELHRAGFFSAHLEKPWGPAMVLTMQGDRRTVAGVMTATSRFLARAGGMVRASMMEERIVLWWTSRPDVPLPPCVDRLIRL